MKIGVISDTHGLLDARIPQLFSGLDHILHAGDIGDVSILERLRQIAPLTAVAGNIDGFRCGDAGEEARVTLGGLRFYLPAYLAADVRDALQTADPVFHLVHGFSEISITHTVSGRAFTRTVGRQQFINPRRYGASTFLDYARYRLSVFSREEAGAIVAYLEYTRQLDSRSSDRDRIDAALAGFWRARAASAPTSAQLSRYLEEEAEYVAALLSERDTLG